MPSDPNHFAHELLGVPFPLSNLPCSPQVTYYTEGGCRIDWVNDRSGNVFLTLEVDANYRNVLAAETIDLAELLNVTSNVIPSVIPPHGVRPK